MQTADEKVKKAIEIFEKRFSDLDVKNYLPYISRSNSNEVKFFDLEDEQVYCVINVAEKLAS